MTSPSEPRKPAFSLRVRTRGYETDRSRTIPLVQFMSYLEQLRWDAMQLPDLGLLEHLHSGHFFIVRNQTVELVRSVGLGVELELRGVLERVGRCSAFVRHEVVRVDDGVLVAHARVNGVWLGPDRRLARIPSSMREYGAQQEAQLSRLMAPSGNPDITVTKVIRQQEGDTSFLQPDEVIHRTRGLEVERIDAVPDDNWVHSRVVLPSDLDVFNHVNAARYADFFLDARQLGGAAEALGTDSASAGRTATRIAIDYRQEAVLGDELEVRCWPLNQRLAFGCAVTRPSDDALLCTARIDVADPVD